MTKKTELIQFFLNKGYISIGVFQKGIGKTILSSFNPQTSIYHSSNILSIHMEYASIIVR